MKALEFSAHVLTQATVSRNSSRNCLYRLWEASGHTDRALFNAIYHYSMETVRRQNFLDEFVNRALIDMTPDLFVLNLFRIATYMTKVLNDSLESVATKIEAILYKIRDDNEVRYLVTRLFRLGTIDHNIIYNEKSIEEQLSLQYTHPIWFVKYFTRLLGQDECINLMEANNEPKTVCIRVNTLKTTMEKAHRELEVENIVLEEDSDFPDLLRVVSWKDTPVILSSAYKEGRVFIQDKASCAAAYALDPSPGETVLDMCSAPGMKTSLLAQLMENQGRIIAVEFSPNRMRSLQQTMNRAAVTIVEPVIADVRNLNPIPVDRLLLDPPCSSTGIFHRYPDSKWRVNYEVVRERALFQQILLDTAMRFLDTSSVGVYSVCSTMPEEGEQLIDSYLDRIKLIPIPIGRSGLKTGVHDEIFQSGPKIIRYWPHKDDSAGFFIAKFTKLP